jgi:hypothetical protein
MSTHRRGWSRRRTAWPEQNPHSPTASTELGLLNNTQDTQTSYAHDVSYSDTPLSSYSTDPTVAGVDSGANTGSVDYGGGWDYGSSVDAGGGTDFGGFDGGGDFGGGGAGGDWGGSSSSE